MYTAEKCVGFWRSWRYSFVKNMLWTKVNKPSVKHLGTSLQTMSNIHPWLPGIDADYRTTLKRSDRPLFEVHSSEKEISFKSWPWESQIFHQDCQPCLAAHTKALRLQCTHRTLSDSSSFSSFVNNEVHDTEQLFSKSKPTEMGPEPCVLCLLADTASQSVSLMAFSNIMQKSGFRFIPSNVGTPHPHLRWVALVWASIEPPGETRLSLLAISSSSQCGLSTVCYNLLNTVHILHHFVISLPVPFIYTLFLHGL